MDESAVTEYITQTFPEVGTTTNFGYTFFLSNRSHLALRDVHLRRR
jgi:hypothetical protein